MAGLSHEREEELFFACLDLPAPSGARTSSGSAARDTRLRQRLERLLAAHGRAEVATLSPLHDFLDPAAAALAGAAGPAEGGEGSRPGAWARRSGPIACCASWPRAAWAACGSPSAATAWSTGRSRSSCRAAPGGGGLLAARMAREREILATLNHPNIARLYDAGLTADGQPYLALEYVDGRRIDEYCREREARS